MIDREYPYVDEHEFNSVYIFEKVDVKPRMTCLEKLKSVHPNWDEEILYGYIHRNCPSYHGYMPDPRYCAHGAVEYQCTACWNREIKE